MYISNSFLNNSFAQNPNFGMHIKKNNLILNVLEYNKNQLTKENYDEVIKLCRAIDGIKDKKPHNGIYECKSSVSEHYPLYKPAYYAINIFSNLANSKTWFSSCSTGFRKPNKYKDYPNEINSITTKLANNTIINNGTTFLNNKKDKYKTLMFNKYILNNLDNFDNILSDYGKKTLSLYKNKVFTNFTNKDLSIGSNLHSLKEYHEKYKVSLANKSNIANIHRKLIFMYLENLTNTKSDKPIFTKTLDDFSMPDNDFDKSINTLLAKIKNSSSDNNTKLLKNELNALLKQKLDNIRSALV
ncbi:hypothetical protein J6A31_02480 [bacterium]|nr:hypothetical protein [bacterium]